MGQATLVRRRSASLERAFGRVGEPEAEFRSRRVLPLAAMLGGLLLLVGGGAALWWVLPKYLTAPLPVLIVLPVMPIVLGMVAIWFGWRVWGERWFVCPGGMVRQHGSRAEACGWDDFLTINQSQDRGTYWLHRKDGAAWQLSAANTPEVSELGRTIRLKAEKHGVAWKMVAK